LSLQGSEAASRGDFLFSSDHLIEMATKLYRTTLSQTKQRLNIEISDEYVYVLFNLPFHFHLISFINAAITFSALSLWLVFEMDEGDGQWMTLAKSLSWVPDVLTGEINMHK
jgi:hypothetical protein